MFVAETHLTDGVRIEPLLLDLGFHGGATLTYPLRPGSPARERVPVEDCTDPWGEPLLVNQGGEARPRRSGMRRRRLRGPRRLASWGSRARARAEADATARRGA